VPYPCSFIDCVTQVFALVYLFYFPSFAVPLILFTLPLSLVEHHHFRLLNIQIWLFLPHIFSQVLHHFFRFSFILCYNYRVVRKRQTKQNKISNNRNSRQNGWKGRVQDSKGILEKKNTRREKNTIRETEEVERSMQKEDECM
jgi:hypothetical protein